MGLLLILSGTAPHSSLVNTHSWTLHVLHNK